MSLINPADAIISGLETLTSEATKHLGETALVSLRAEVIDVIKSADVEVTKASARLWIGHVSVRMNNEKAMQVSAIFKKVVE